jgi:NAD(P)-dependent dehydrogenase (short-subunit alcohol dehydrogenase family)
MQLKETHAVVTGGASGLGLAVVKRIVQAGGKATFLDVSLIRPPKAPLSA